MCKINIPKIRPQLLIDLFKQLKTNKKYNSFELGHRKYFAVNKCVLVIM